MADAGAVIIARSNTKEARVLASIRLYAQLLGKYLRPYWPVVALVGLLMLGATVLQVVAPQIVRRFIDLASEQGDLDSLYMAAVLFLGAGISVHVLQALYKYIGRGIAWRATNRLRLDLTLHTLRLDMGFHNTRTPGELLERIDGDVERLANFFSQLFVQLVSALLLMAGLIIATWLEDWRFGLAVAVFALFFLVTRVRLLYFLMPFWEVESEARAQLYGFLGERITGIRDIQKSGAVPFTMARLYETLRRRVLSWMKAGIVGRLVWGVVSTFNSFRYPLGLAVGAYLFYQGEITIGTVYLIWHYFLMIQTPVHAISREFEDLQRAGASIRRVKEVLDTAPGVKDGPGTALSKGRPSIQFDDVSFSYRAGTRVLHDVSFRLEPGQTLGLLGRTGSGKSTMSRLLFRFYDPEEGAVKIDGVDLRSLRLDDLRSRVGMVTQEVQLFEATVRDNLTLFDPSVPDRRIDDTLGSLGLEDWRGSLPDGLDTWMTSGGRLSAGEGQLLAFARVFLRDPDCVVLDEASSRLDPATERLVQRAVDRLLSERTAIVIAHRLATIQRVDRILVLEGGQVREHGDREALSRDPDSVLSGLLRTGLEEVLT